MSITHVVGIDPGLVHTGVVSLAFIPKKRGVIVRHEVILGPNARAVTIAANRFQVEPPRIFIEGYRPRSNLNSDKRMVEAVAEIRKFTKGTVLDNMGVKKVVRRQLLELLGVWRFTTVTNHQDLRSAAYIALFGMLKDPELNVLLADVVRDHLNGRTWHVDVQ